MSCSFYRARKINSETEIYKLKTTNMNYDVNYFIKKFEAIPEELWCTYSIQRNEQMCAQGHCGVNIDNHRDIANSAGINKEADALGFIFSKYRIDGLGKVANINNGDNSKYQQPSPKQRVLAALYDIKKTQEPVKPTVIYKVVEVDRKVKELVKEPIMN